MDKIDQPGFLTLAQNTDSVNYLKLAYLQALNIKATQKNNLYAVIVDTPTYKAIEDRHKKVFDFIIPLNIDYNTGDRPFANEWQAYFQSPFKETIKLEADLLFTRSVDHWWTAFRLKDVCLSHGAKNVYSIQSGVRKYRELFDANQLPDVYNGLMYFRYTRTAEEFFRTAQAIFMNWDNIRKDLIKCHEDKPTTDVVYALASLIVGPERVTMPSMDFINFVHMKSGFNGWSDTQSWMDTVMTERDGDVIRINNLNQYDPVHYHDKNYATEELIEYYEQRVLAGS